MSQSPGLLQPWVSRCTSFSTRNGLRHLDATALRLKSGIQFRNPGLAQRQPWALRHNRFAVKQPPYYSLIQSVAHPIKQATCVRLVPGFDNNANHRLRVGSSYVYPTEG